MIIKKLFGTIGGIVFVVLLLLIVNQVIIAIRLYQSEKIYWGRMVKDVLVQNMDSLVSVFDYHIQTNLVNDTNEADTKRLFSRVDSSLRHYLPENLKDIPLHYFSKSADRGIMHVFPAGNRDTTGMVHTPLLLSLGEESVWVYFDLPFTLFWERYWQQLQGIFISFLLLLFFLAGIIYLNRRQRRLSALQEGMMQQIIHDFNTPLNSMSTLLELIRTGAENEHSSEKEKKYNLIESQLNSMRAASSSLLGSLSQICEANIEKRMFDLKEGILLLMEEQQWSNRDNKIQMQLDYRIPVSMIYASPVHLFCVIRNLLDNAIKYSEGTVDITICCLVKGDGIVITVSDKGKGIPSAQQKKIFMKYYRGEDRKKRVKGFGLGLAYVKKIIKAHGGKVWVESEQGKGSTFGIYLDEW